MKFEVGDRVEFIDNYGGRVKIGDKAIIVSFLETMPHICRLKTLDGSYDNLSCCLVRLQKIKSKHHLLTKIFGP